MEYTPSRSFTTFLGLALFAAGVITGSGPIASRIYDPQLQRYQDNLATTASGLSRIHAAYNRRVEDSQREIEDYNQRLEWANAHVCNNAGIYVPKVGLLKGNQLWRRFEGDFENGYCIFYIERDIICQGD